MKRNRQARNEKAPPNYNAKSAEEEEPPVVKKVYTPKGLFTKTEEELYGYPAPIESNRLLAMKRSYTSSRQTRNEKTARHDAKSAEEEEPPVVKKVYTPKGLFTKTEEELYECNELFTPRFKREKLSTVNTPSTTPTLNEKALLNPANAKRRASSTTHGTPSTVPSLRENALNNSTKSQSRASSTSQNTPSTKAHVNSAQAQKRVSSTSHNQNTLSTEPPRREQEAVVKLSEEKAPKRMSASSSHQQTKNSASNLTCGGRHEEESSSNKRSKSNGAAALVTSKQPDAPCSSRGGSKRKRSEDAIEVAPSPIAQKMFPYKLRGKTMVVAVRDEPLRKKVLAEMKRYGMVIATSIDKNCLPYCIISDNINATLLEERPEYRLPKVAIDDFPSPLREAFHLKVRIREAGAFLARFKEFRQKDEPPMPLLFEWQHAMFDAATIRSMMAERNRYLEYQRRHNGQSPSKVDVVKVKEETVKPAPAPEVIQLD